tara:strand:- start:201 stop:446 length:246 start_codon:yes stop_codon:yes gene_type:complete
LRGIVPAFSSSADKQHLTKSNQLKEKKMIKQRNGQLKSQVATQPNSDSFDDYQGELEDRYQIYIDFTDELYPKTFDEWLDS